MADFTGRVTRLLLSWRFWLRVAVSAMVCFMCFGIYAVIALQTIQAVIFALEKMPADAYDLTGSVMLTSMVFGGAILSVCVPIEFHTRAHRFLDRLSPTTEEVNE